MLSQFKVAGMIETTTSFQNGLSTRFGHTSLHAALVTACRGPLREMVVHNLMS